MLLTPKVSLNLNFNQLTSTVPAWLGKFSGLQALSLGGNSLTGDLSLSGIEKLTGLGKEGKFLIRMFFCFLSNRSTSLLERFEVQTNSALQGKMHEILTALPKLEYFDVSATTISGHFPNSTAISNLQVLKAVHTPLTGTIPDSIGSWTNLSKYLIDVIAGLVKCCDNH